MALTGAAALAVGGAIAWATLEWRAEAPSPSRAVAARAPESGGTPDAMERASQALATAPSPRVEEGKSGVGARVSPPRPLAPSQIAPETNPEPRQASRPEAEAVSNPVRPEASPRLAVEPAPRPVPLSPQQVSRIQTQAEQKLQSRGLLRASPADRWGVVLETGPAGEITLTGVLRDMALYAEAVRLVREVPGVQDVRGSVEVSEVGAVSVVQSESARIQAEIQQRLRSRGLLRESSADRWGVTVEVSPEGDVTLVGDVRDVEMHREAVRRAQEVAKVRMVKQDIRVMDRGNGQ